MVDYYSPQMVQQYASSTAIAYNLDIDLFVETLDCESQFNWQATGQLGEVGVAQIYRRYHPEVTIEQARDPYWSIDWMAKNWLAGHEEWWSCYKIISGRR